MVAVDRQRSGGSVSGTEYRPPARHPRQILIRGRVEHGRRLPERAAAGASKRQCLRPGLRRSASDRITARAASRGVRSRQSPLDYSALGRITRRAQTDPRALHQGSGPPAQVPASGSGACSEAKPRSPAPHGMTLCRVAVSFSTWPALSPPQGRSPPVFARRSDCHCGCASPVPLQLSDRAEIVDEARKTATSSRASIGRAPTAPVPFRTP